MVTLVPGYSVLGKSISDTAYVPSAPYPEDGREIGPARSSSTGSVEGAFVLLEQPEKIKASRHKLNSILFIFRWKYYDYFLGISLIIHSTKHLISLKFLH